LLKLFLISLKLLLFLNLSSVLSLNHNLLFLFSLDSLHSLLLLVVLSFLFRFSISLLHVIIFFLLSSIFSLLEVIDSLLFLKLSMLLFEFPLFICFIVLSFELCNVIGKGFIWLNLLVLSW
jgi:hypothetical protein